MRILLFSMLLFLMACQPNVQKEIENKSEKVQTAFELNIPQEDLLNYKDLAVYPILANEEHIESHKELAAYKNLKEAIDIIGFRITESKKYGRDGNRGLVNTLTVQNKSQDTVYLMTGDVVQGGKQDRILAQDLVLPPRQLTDIEVFCVEQNRWQYQEDNIPVDDQKAQQNKKVFAFTGYYNVASNALRKTIKEEKGQQEVWAKVSELTSLNNAESSTSAYAALESSEDFTKQRNEYLDFFKGRMTGRDQVVGMIVTSGSKILGTDIFNHPTLFKKQYEVLMHGYVIDAISEKQSGSVSKENMEKHFEKIQALYIERSTGEADKSAYVYNGKVIHFVD